MTPKRIAELVAEANLETRRNIPPRMWAVGIHEMADEIQRLQAELALRPSLPEQGLKEAVEALEIAGRKMAGALIQVPIFHRCGFPNASKFEPCLTCQVDEALNLFNATVSALRTQPVPTPASEVKP